MLGSTATRCPPAPPRRALPLRGPEQRGTDPFDLAPPQGFSGFPPYTSTLQPAALVFLP